MKVEGGLGREGVSRRETKEDAWGGDVNKVYTCLCVHKCKTVNKFKKKSPTSAISCVAMRSHLTFLNFSALINKVKTSIAFGAGEVAW